MIKKAVTYCLITLAVLLFCGYFAAASFLSLKGRSGELCTDISVTVLDSASNRFVSPSDIRSIITSSEVNPVGRPRSEASLHGIETLLESRSAIRHSDASISRDGILRVSITQRRPLLRIQTDEGAFYIDDAGYIFPWVSTFTTVSSASNELFAGLMVFGLMVLSASPCSDASSKRLSLISNAII